MDNNEQNNKPGLERFALIFGVIVLFGYLYKESSFFRGLMGILFLSGFIMLFALGIDTLFGTHLIQPQNN
jgi:hypothetical protein